MLPAHHADIGFALQTAKGVAASAATHRSPLVAGTYLPRRVLAEDPSSTTSALGTGSYPERIAALGDPTWVVRPKMLGLLLYGALGAKAVSGAGPYLHTFTIGATLPWLTAWSMLGDELFARVADTKVRSLELAARAGGLLTATASLAGLGSTSRDTPQAVALERTDAFVHADAAGALLVEGVAVAAIEDVRVSITTGAEIADTLVGPDIRDGRMSIRIRTIQTIEDVALWNRLHYGDPTPAAGDPTVEDLLELGGSPAGIDFTWARPSGASLQVLAPRLVVQDPIDGLEANARGGPVRTTVTYGVYRPAAGSGFTAKLTNAVAAY